MNKDVFNVFNGNAVTAENPSVPAAFCRPDADHAGAVRQDQCAARFL